MLEIHHSGREPSICFCVSVCAYTSMYTDKMRIKLMREDTVGILYQDPLLQTLMNCDCVLVTVVMNVV